jgi:hypothetical protein
MTTGDGADSEEEGAMGVGAIVEVRNVKVVAESVFGLCCRIAGRDHWIAPHRLLAGSTVAHFGDRGLIVVAREFADENALVRGFRPSTHP